jgi:hypothetical protein
LFSTTISARNSISRSWTNGTFQRVDIQQVKATADGCFVLELEALRHSAVWLTMFKLGGHADFD